MSTGWHTQTKDQQEVMHHTCIQWQQQQWEGMHASCNNSSSTRSSYRAAATSAVRARGCAYTSQHELQSHHHQQQHQWWGSRVCILEQECAYSTNEGWGGPMRAWGHKRWPPHLPPRLNHPVSCMPHQLMCVLASVGLFGTNIGGNGGHWQTPLPVLYILYIYICILFIYLSLY